MSVEVIVIAEGPSDIDFIKRVVNPALEGRGIYLKPQSVKTSDGHYGGAVNFDRLKRHARNVLGQFPGAYLTTFLDLYALDSKMPGVAQAKALTDPGRKAQAIEQALQTALVEYVQCRPERVLPHIQPYELEGLFFSSPAALVSVVPQWAGALSALMKVRRSVETPEHINDGFDTKPSARLESLLDPPYRKKRHAGQIGVAIGLSKIQAECPHFARWFDRVSKLAPL